jgi:uncharacterized protein YaaW (UPF0174 family)
MGKGKRVKRQKKGLKQGFLKEFSERFTANFQRELRNSEIWDEMVAEFGEKRAKEILKDCKAEVKPGVAPDGSGDRTEDIS